MTGLGMALCVGAHLWPSRVAVQRLAPVLAAVLSGTAGVLLINGLLTDRPNLDGLRSAQGKSADALETLWVAPAASLAFMVTGAALYLARTPLVANAQRLTTGAVILVTVLGFLGLAGGLLELEHLYRLARHVRMPTDTAIGLCGVAAGLWFLRDQLFHKEDPRHPHKLAHRIVYRAAGALSLAAVGAGLAGFAAMHHTFKATVAESTAQAARTQALALANTLRNSLWFPRTVATRPTVIQTVAALDKDAEDASARQFMPLLAASFLTAGIDGVRFTDSQARLIGVAGAFPAQDAAAINTFRDEGQEVELRWNGGYVLHTRTPVHDGLRVVGHVHTQRRLVLFDELVGTLRSHSETSDALICSQRGEAAFCAPTRFYPTPFEIPMFTARGEPTLPINRALLGESGVTFTTDLRQVPVVAGYTPIGKYGLGLVVKVDVATLYGPLKTDLNYAVLAVALLVALGTWALKTRVQPLLRAVVDEQLRTQAILATSGDAFIDKMAS